MHLTTVSGRAIGIQRVTPGDVSILDIAQLSDTTQAHLEAAH